MSRAQYLHQAHERSGMIESEDSIYYEEFEGRPPIITIRTSDNYDDPGRPPGRFEREDITVDEFLRRYGDDHPAVKAYRRLLLGSKTDVED